MKKTITVLTLVATLSTPALALKKDNIEAGMHTKIDSVLVVLAKKTSTATKGREIISMMDSLFDYTLMAKLALGQDTWNKITPAQKSEFTKEFITKLKQSYVEKLELYNNQKVAYKGVAPYQKGRLQLKTELIGKGETYKINYNFHDSDKNGDWLIYDVDLAGVSIVQSNRKQFAGQLKTKSFDQLLESIKLANNR